jgi:hypothetical protein
MSMFSSFKETQMLFESWRREIKETEGEEVDVPLKKRTVSDQPEIEPYVEANFRGGMTMEEFDQAFEAFEVKFDLEYPKSLFKLHSALDSFNPGLARTLRSLYESEFEERNPDPFLQEQIGEDLRPQLKAIVAAWNPTTAEGKKYENQVLALLGGETPAITEKKRK